MNAIFTPSSAEPAVPPVDTLPLDRIDVSDARLFEQNLWEPYFARLRDEDPVHYIEDSPFGPFWSITRYDDIVYVDSHHQQFSSEPFVVIGDRGEDLPVEMFISMDPPKHDEQRNAVQSVVAPKNLAELEGIIRSRVITILDGLPVGESFNWVEKVSVELTAQMLATIFGFPFEDRHKLIHWSDLMAALPEMTGADIDPEYRTQELMDCARVFSELWHQRLAENKDGEMSYDLISLMQASEATKDILDRPMEFLGNLGLLIVGGNDTTRNSISGGVLALNENPAEYDKLRADHSLIPNMVSEIIRWQTPLAHMRRIATEDVELGGKTIKKGDKVVMWYVSGNRDERSIENPNQFLIDRKNARRHISFGFGVHRCMGNRLAEMQLRILWEEIMQRFEKIEVVGEPVRVRSNFVKGFSELPVRLIPVS
ncbi:MAG: cytochrome P450 [Candidatus Pelagadaptatus aseana]|uniref:cytochrome P450 n=1 Tax=Candidatus Pelagadaptatus aseana TaxID=3120508 RepID=UPI0039B20742